MVQSKLGNWSSSRKYWGYI